MMCRICKKELKRTDLTSTDLDDEEKAVFHGSFGAACLSHKGVRHHYEELLQPGDDNKNEDCRA